LGHQHLALQQPPHYLRLGLRVRLALHTLSTPRRSTTAASSLAKTTYALTFSFLTMGFQLGVYGLYTSMVGLLDKLPAINHQRLSIVHY
jgi:hypothetical protein